VELFPAHGPFTTINDEIATTFLWCNADDKPARRSWIKKKRGLAMSLVNEEQTSHPTN
jgi:hypothetical protein